MKISKTISQWLFYGAVLPLFMGFCTWQSWQWWSWSISPPSRDDPIIPDPDETIQLNIPSGTTTQQIGTDLKSAGIIRSVTAWQLWSIWLELQNPQGSFKAGTYQLSLRDPLPNIAEQIWKGQVMQVRFTIPEGWSIQKMAEYFEDLGYFKATDFIKATRQIPQEKYPWLPDNLPHLEGFLYPDTYKLIDDSTTPEVIINMMLDRFQEVALPVYQESPKKPFNIRQWVTLASIVEKEAVVEQERPVIAGVFVSRLRRGMKLESDPTVEYFLGIQQTPDKPLTLQEIKQPSPYNTYLNKGLPPTPIASPGLASLKATLEPAITSYLFFVARYDGTHIFSQTLKEHEAAVKKIRQMKRIDN